MWLGRWLLVAAILVISAAVGVTYVKRKEAQASDTPVPPKLLDKGIEGRADKWTYTQTDGDRPRVRIRADSFRQIKEPSLVELDGVELEIYHHDAKKFDLVKSARAEFDIAAKSLYSDGEVEITMAVPDEDDPPTSRLVKIHTSGARFASDTGVATTDRQAKFDFDRGGGSATGAEYNPMTRELHLKSDVKLDWTGKAGSVPMHAESGEALYRERESKVILYPWSKLQRDTLNLDAQMSVILLENERISHADIVQAKGLQDHNGRKVEFGADQVALDFDKDMVVRKVTGEHNGRLISSSDTAKTTVTANELELDFTNVQKESVMTNAVATGNAVAESAPIPRPGVLAADTRVLKSETIRMKMKADGKQLDTAETDGAGTLDFVPNRQGQPKRFVKGDRFWIAYGADNRIQSFRTVNAQTRTERPPTPREATPPPALTESQEMVATFNPATSELDKLEQTKAFHYEEGGRQARAEKATLDSPKDLITLTGAARVWDPTGLSVADKIVLNQKTGDYTAEGHVASTREPDKKGQSSAMLSHDDLLQARADKMVATDNHRKIHYEGNAVAWQGANRVEAEKLDIDRQRRVLEAHGKVVSQFVDKPDPKKPQKEQQPVFTVVRAPELIYTEENRVALYQGGTVSLVRPGLTVDGQTLRAFLKDSSEESSLDKAFTDGNVRIVSTAPNKRTRTGTGDHSEYYTADQKVILEGSAPLLVDNVKGRTTGKQLTWFADNDRLLVDGQESKPAEATIIRRK